MKRVNEASFSDPELDSLLLKWLSKGLQAQEMERIEELLVYNPRFREDFGDWLRSLRDPSWLRQDDSRGES